MRFGLFLSASILIFSLNTFAQAPVTTKAFSGSIIGSSARNVYRDLSEQAAKWCFDDNGLDGVGFHCDPIDCGIISCTLTCHCSYWPKKKKATSSLMTEMVDPVAEM